MQHTNMHHKKTNRHNHQPSNNYIDDIFHYSPNCYNMILHLHSTFKLAASLIVVCGSVITPAVAIDNVDVHWTEEDTTDNVQYQAAAGLRTSTIEESAIVVAVS